MSDMPMIKKRIAMNEPHLITPAPAGLVSFDTNMIAPLKECRINFSPVQEGSGDPSPSNVRPITGWTGITANGTGKNLAKFVESKGPMNFFYNAWQGWIVDNYFMIPDRSIEYTYSAYFDCRNSQSDGARAKIWYYDQDGNYVAYSEGNAINSGEQGWSIVRINKTSGSTRYYAGCGIGLTAGSIATQGMVEKGSARTDYEPFGASFTINWSSSAGTVYGGYVDLVSGSVVAEWKQVNFNSEIYFDNEQASGIVAVGITDVLYAAETIISDMFSKNISSGPGRMVQSSFNQYLYFVFPKDQLDTYDSTGVRKWVATYHPVFVGKLTTPITYQLDPVTLKTLRGINNIWSNANGNVELKYWKH